jgi:hypothetical protein
MLFSFDVFLVPIYMYDMNDLKRSDPAERQQDSQKITTVR